MTSFETEVYNREGENVIGARVIVSADNGQTIDEIQVTNKTQFDELKGKLDTLNEDYVQFADNSPLAGKTLDNILQNPNSNINAMRLGGLAANVYSQKGHTHLKKEITDLYNYDITASNYNMNLGSSSTADRQSLISVRVTNMNNSPVPNHEIIIYKNGTLWRTGRTNSSGVFSTQYTAETEGIVTFQVNNQKVQCNVKYDTGWVSLKRANAPYFVFNSKVEARRIGNIVHIRGAVKTISTVPFVGWSDYWAIADLPDERFYANAPETSVFQCSGKQRCMGRVLSGSGGNISIGRFTNADDNGNYTLFNNAGIEVSMNYFVD